MRDWYIVVALFIVADQKIIKKKNGEHQLVARLQPEFGRNSFVQIRNLSTS